ncbi:hypothetical protein [Microbacterium sp. T32]|uniref:hypothetical protein n=1 Tax=Microbacterium sp. T32 TaxID=1776083 RepID=UPI0007AB8B5F|nr:hypothetical protein [Microbacterium sp. T32]KZE43304.1 hypothetical protein AVW09_00755 [Microbacterium sp. T32]
MAGHKKSVKSDGWALFDRVVRTAPLRGVTPWHHHPHSPVYEPDYDTLKMLLRVPAFLGSSSTTGLPALALDVWVAYELRRAGFEPDAVWPRDDVPRILPGPIAGLLQNMGKADAARLRQLLASGNTFGGTVAASAKVLGKNYMKQVDVVMSDWDTGPELLISTKRMDDSYTNNAPNRMEESYGDAKNLRSRHPRAALGFVFSLRSNAFDEAPRAAAWILDLLAKLGREDDAYDAVALIVPRYGSTGVGDPETSEPGGDDEPEALQEATEVELLPPTEVEPLPTSDQALGHLLDQLQTSPPVELDLDAVPEELSARRFFGHMVRHVLDNSPITRHEEARRLLEEATVAPSPR